MALQGLIDSYLSDTLRSDTSIVAAAIIGRRLLGDENEAITKGGLDVKEYVIGYDGLAVAVPVGMSIEQTTRERLQAALRSPAATLQMLDSTAPPTPIRFLLPDQNSSVLSLVRAGLLGDSNVSAPVRYLSTSDSLLNETAAGNGIAIMGWYRAHLDSVHLRTLRMGYRDSTGVMRQPGRVHVSSLVTDTYPLKQPLVGYTFASVKSLAVGFLASVAKGSESQAYLVNQGLQGENVRLRLVMPDEGGK